MALSPTSLSGLMTPMIFAKLQAAFPEVSTSPEQLQQQQKMAKAIAEGVSEAIIPYIIASAQVMVMPGIAVATAGSPSAQTGATTAPGQGKIM